jgi:hypothetical protein
LNSPLTARQGGAGGDMSAFWKYGPALRVPSIDERIDADALLLAKRNYMAGLA